MTIVDGGLVPYEVPFTQTYRTAEVTHDTRRGLLVHVATDDGLLGLGEAAPLSSRTEPLAEARAALEAALDRLATEQLGLEEALEELDELAGGARAARFGLSLALEDALAKREGLPLAASLAERYLDEASPLERVPVNATIPDADVETTRRRARQAAEAGFEVIKLKAGRGALDRDLDRIDAVHEAAPEARLRVDANQAFATIDEARPLLRALEAYPVEYLEQPLGAEDLQAMARLRNEAQVPVAADEPARDPRSVRATLLARACDVLVVKPMVLGGVDRGLQAARLAHREAVDAVLTTTIDTAVARAGVLHVAAALGADELAHGLATGWLLEEEPASFEERVEQGHVPVPEKPGHGASRESGETKLRHPGDA